MAIWLVKIQLMLKMTSEPEGWILGSDWGLWAIRNILYQQTQNDKDKGWEYGINHNASKQEIQEQ